MSGNTEYLVVGEGPGDTELRNAEAHDVARVDEDELRQMLRG